MRRSKLCRQRKRDPSAARQDMVRLGGSLAGQRQIRQAAHRHARGRVAARTPAPLFPTVGAVNGAGNDLNRPAEAMVTVVIDGQTLIESGVDPAAALQQTKWHRVEVLRPGVDEFNPCFGFTQ